MKESIFNNYVLIYHYGIIKKINQIYQKLLIDGPIFQTDQSILNKGLDKIINYFQEKLQQQELIKHTKILQNLQKIEFSVSNVEKSIVEEYQILDQSLQQIKLIGIDFIHNSIYGNKNIIEYKKQQTKPLNIFNLIQNQDDLKQYHQN
ncbi:unnamed protein product [Paramecium sonneborni]|uniref:Uncharacterized protein n=1 Tax=Paramecium sonneborni TaxID=65129 RepID=A0A8S1R8M3_9CILI|nr:unnamed protein product [Paramecium sonneborni]